MASPALPSHARVVVVGGGVVGCSVLYHLAKKGWQDCVLLERRELSCGSSWHAAGQFHIINSNANLSSLQLHTINFYPQLQEESGQDIGLHITGGIYFASTQERLNYLKTERAKNRRTNPDMEFIDLAEAKRMHPLIAEKHFLGALYDPIDGYIDPASVVQAYAKAAKKNGAQVFQHTMVTGIERHGDEWRVHTDAGTITAEHVVNAGGLWAREIGGMVGLQLPLMAMEHHYLITEPIDKIVNLGHELPSFVDFDGNAYGRQEGQGMLLGTYEQGGSAWSVDETPWDFGHELLPNKLERIAGRLETAYEHFPQLATTGIKKVVNGPFTFAPDGNALIGPVPGLRNFWCACAVMAGYAQGAGIGKVFANWMVDGEPGIDVFAMDIARFGEFATHRYAHEKVVENFGRRFQITYPNEELPAMRELRTTSLYDIFKARGAVFGASFGLEHALWFAPSAEEAVETPTFHRSNAFPHIAAEVAAVREGVGVIELANFGKHEICGDGAAAWLDTLLAGELPEKGRMRLLPMLSPRGKLLGDLSVAALDDGEYLIIASGAAQVAHARHFQASLPDAADNSVRIRNRSGDLHGIAIAGPRARDLLARLTRADVGGEAFKFMSARRLAVGGVPAIVLRVSFTGELGYEIYCAAEYQRALWRAIAAAGKDLAVRPFGARALMSMRLEKSFGAWTMEYREDFTPMESGLNRFVAYNKMADFVGKTAALAERRDGAARKLIALAIDADDVNADATGDEQIMRNGDYVGMITSGGYGHYVKQSLALGYVDAAAETAETAGTEFTVEILGKQCVARLLPQPTYDPSGEKMRA